MADDPIVVDGWSPRFARAVEHVLKTEGGFVDHPRDPGGATKYGISLRFLKAEGNFDLDNDGLRDFDLDFDGDIDGQDVRKLTLQDARFLYHRCFWQQLQCDNLPPPIGEMVFDQAVNGGRLTGVKLLQQSINACLAKAASAPPQIPVDGVIGNDTLQAMNWVVRWGNLGTPALISEYRFAAQRRYQLLVRRNPKLQVFLKGWLRRAEGLGR